jgi:hypothetical protein
MSVERFGRYAELYHEVAGEVLRLDLTTFLTPEPHQGRFIAAHNDPRVRATYKGTS